MHTGHFVLLQISQVNYYDIKRHIRVFFLIKYFHSTFRRKTELNFSLDAFLLYLISEGCMYRSSKHHLRWMNKTKMQYYDRTSITPRCSLFAHCFQQVQKTASTTTNHPASHLSSSNSLRSYLSVYQSKFSCQRALGFELPPPPPLSRWRSKSEL